MINKELALRMNADFSIPSRDEDEPPYRNLPYSRYVNHPQEMISNKTNYTKYSDKTVLEIMKNTMGVPDIKDVINNRITIWLEPYYMIQTRDIYDTDCSCWRNLRLASKEEYVEWNKKENNNG